jgi:hypothetical protein
MKAILPFAPGNAASAGTTAAPVIAAAQTDEASHTRQLDLAAFTYVTRSP